MAWSPEVLTPGPVAAPPKAAVVEAVAASKRYGSGASVFLAVRDVTMAVAPGEFLALMGRSGCGKTTLLNLLGAMDMPSAGVVRLAGQDTRQGSDEALTALRRRYVGFVFQAFHLLPTLTVRENIELPLLLGGAPERGARVEALAARVGLVAKLDSYPTELSGGEMQRVALARALVHRPRLVIADEPTGNLDSHAAAAVLELLRELSRDAGAAVVMATHSQDAAAWADRRLHMRDGALES